MTANHIACQRCHEPVRRGEAVIRSQDFRQVAWCKDCYTLHRAVGDIVVVEVPVMPLTRRLDAVRAGRS